MNAFPGDQALDEIAAKLKESRTEPTGLAPSPTWGEVARDAILKPLFGVRFLHGVGLEESLQPPGPGAYRFFLGEREGIRPPVYAFVSRTFRGSDLLVFWGANPMVSHDIPNTPVVLRNKKKDPGFLLAVVDPRVTETAKLADIHLRLRPGTDALLFKAMIKILLTEGPCGQGLSCHQSGRLRSYPGLV